MRAFPQLPSGSRPHAELPGVSTGYPPPRGRLPTCSAPVRRVSDPKVTPLDLHALGTPPALILSQDQTLHHCSLLCLPSLCPDCGSHPTHPDPKTCVGVCGRNSLARAPACRRPRHQSPVTLTCAKERKTDNRTPSPPPCLHQDAPETDSPLAPSSAYATRYRTYPNLRVCQLVKVAPRNAVTHVCRRWPLGHAGNRVNRSSRPGDRSVSRARRHYRILGTLSRANSEDRSPASRDAHLPITAGFPPREEDAYLPLRNPTSIAHRHCYVKCVVRRVSAPGRHSSLALLAT